MADGGSAMALSGRTTSGTKVRLIGLAAVAAVVLALVGSPGGLGAKSHKQKTFASPGEAVAALVDALKANDIPRVKALFGPAAEEIVSSGDEVADKATRDAFLQLYAEKNALGEEKDGQVILLMGADEWPFPIPLVKEGARWRFDAEAGREEILNRRVGKNELETIETCRAIVEAQREYAIQDWDGNGLNEYAQRFRSTQGKRDGLFWETQEGEALSPLGPLAAEAAQDGYAVGTDPAPAAFHGYYYKVLTAQGPHAADGAYEYLVKGRMVGGFAVVAYPAEYGNSGVMTFIVNHAGVVYQKDLGEETEALAKAMTQYDPDATWKRVEAEAPTAR